MEVLILVSLFCIKRRIGTFPMVCINPAIIKLQKSKYVADSSL